MNYLLQQLLQNSAFLEPKKIAIVEKKSTLNYQQLEEKSNQLANYFNELGIKKGDRIGIYISKSIEAVIAIFGILKAGGTYVPLDYNSPVKRISLILEDCGIKVIISNSKKFLKLQSNLSSKLQLQSLILLDKLAEKYKTKLSFSYIIWDEILTKYGKNLNFETNLIEEDLAYILYTSGSTGTPKGVMINHRAALTFINWSYQCFKVKQEDNVSSHAPFHFDLSIFDIFTTIKAGATIVLISPELSIFPRNLIQFIEDKKITIWYSVPSILTQMVLRGNLENAQLKNLRLILFAGEVFPVKYLRQLMKILPSTQFYNLYGPTESNVCTYYHLKEIPDENILSIPIGKACENTEILVLTEDEEITKTGEIGELCVRSASLMKGYWGLGEKTKNVLINYFYNMDLGAINIYKTGDLVREDPQGNYLYLGRKDTMIKSRGYRIEAGEIESVLYSHPEIEEAVIIPIADDEIGNQIKAIIVTKEGISLTKNQILSFCTKSLPKYMLPSLIEFRSQLPKTSTGKIDRKSLLL